MSRIIAILCVLTLASTASAGFIVMPSTGGPQADATITLTPTQLIIDLVLADDTGINSPLVGIAAGVTLVGGDGNFSGVTPGGVSAGWTVSAENFILTPDNSWREQVEYGNVLVGGVNGPDYAPGTGDEPVPTGDTYQFGFLKEQNGTPAGTNGDVSSDGQTISHTLVGGYPEGGIAGNDLEGFAPEVGAVLARFVFVNLTGVEEGDLGDVEVYFHKDGMDGGTPDYGPNGTQGEVGPQLLTQDSTNPIMGVVPEPATMGLIGLGLIGLVVRKRR